MTAVLTALARCIQLSLFPAVSRGTGTTNGTGVDALDYEGIGLVVLDSAASAGTLDVTLQESDDNSTFTDILAAAITGGAFVQVVGAASIQQRYIDIGQTKRYIRAKGVGATGATVYGVSLIAQKKYQS